jgi:triphosphoribosyl-dephospho-CoA synthase
MERRADPLRISQCASRALREELAAYPKPGLVSHVDHGSHPDMDAHCFLASIDCLEPFFASMAEAGAAGCSLFSLQQIGLAAEAAMLAATGGRNTHRGAIFSLGLLAAAAGRRVKEKIPATLGAIVAESWGGDLPDDLPGTSDGLTMCRRHRISGARGEAKNGFPSVFATGLPAFRRTCGQTSRHDAGIQAFFEMLARCEDTTLLKRGGEEGWQYGREEAKRFLDAGGVLRAGWLADAAGIHHAFVARHLTAGGVADLLASTFFIDDLDHSL